MVPAVQSSKGLVAAGGQRANNAEAWGGMSPDKMSKFRAPVEWWNLIVCGAGVRIAGLVNVELVCVRSMFTPALSESEGKVSEAIGNGHDRFHAVVSFNEPGPSAGGSADQA